MHSRARHLRNAWSEKARERYRFQNCISAVYHVNCTTFLWRTIVLIVAGFVLATIVYVRWQTFNRLQVLVLNLRILDTIQFLRFSFATTTFKYRLFWQNFILINLVKNLLKSCELKTHQVDVFFVKYWFSWLI